MLSLSPGSIVALAVAAYALPSVVAVLLGRRRQWGIVALNLLLGWTLVGWVAAMGWAVQAQAQTPGVKRSIERSAPNDGEAMAGLAPRPEPASVPLVWDDEQTDNAYANWLDTGEGLAGRKTA